MAMLRHLWERWKVIARLIGDVQSRVLLTLFYFLILAPFGFGVRVLGDPLGLTRQRRSHWCRRDGDLAASWERARRQF